MRIELVSVTALNNGEEVCLTFSISSPQGDRAQKKKLLMFTEKYLDTGLRKGALIDEKEFDRLEEISNTCRAIKKGSDLLSYSALSKSGLAFKLRQRGFTARDAESAASYLESVSLIDEENNAHGIVIASMRKLWGKKRIYAELIKKGYQKSTAAEAVSAIDQRELIKGCKTLINKKVREVPHDPIERKRLIAFLLRYGYSYSEIREAFSEIEGE